MENFSDIEKMVREVCDVVLDQHKTNPNLAQLICDETAKITAPYRDPTVTVTVDRGTLIPHVEISWAACDYYWLFGSVGDALD